MSPHAFGLPASCADELPRFDARRGKQAHRGPPLRLRSLSTAPSKVRIRRPKRPRRKGSCSAQSARATYCRSSKGVRGCGGALRAWRRWAIVQREAKDRTSRPLRRPAIRAHSRPAGFYRRGAWPAILRCRLSLLSGHPRIPAPLRLERPRPSKTQDDLPRRFGFPAREKNELPEGGGPISTPTSGPWHRRTKGRGCLGRRGTSWSPVRHRQLTANAPNAEIARPRSSLRRSLTVPSRDCKGDPYEARVGSGGARLVGRLLGIRPDRNRRYGGPVGSRQHHPRGLGGELSQRWRPDPDRHRHQRQRSPRSERGHLHPVCVQRDFRGEWSDLPRQHHGRASGDELFERRRQGPERPRRQRQRRPRLERGHLHPVRVQRHRKHCHRRVDRAPGRL